MTSLIEKEDFAARVIALICMEATKMKNKNPHMRLGQCVSHVALGQDKIGRYIANNLLSTDSDPFYNDEKIVDFFDDIISAIVDDKV